MRLVSTYAGLDWQSLAYLHSFSHSHTYGQEHFDAMYRRGIRHFPISNYHPSRPTYPLDDFFDNVPADALGCPNAEHAQIHGVSGHYCALGSLHDGEIDNEPHWERAFDVLLDALAYPDGGGIVINHPKRTGPSFESILSILDYDRRVLGLEVYNHRSLVSPKYGQRGEAFDLWDQVLTTGRMTYGFFSPDYHQPWDDATLGRNILLVAERTEAAAARAYRLGHFIGALQGSGLTFTRIEAEDDRISVETNGANSIDFISAQGLAQSTGGDRAVYRVSDIDSFVRIEAKDVGGEHIFSQPILIQA